VDKDQAIVATGYNGAPRRMRHCYDAGCLLEGGHCVRAVHAEINAITNAARRGVPLEGCTAYCTLLPCIQCLQALYACGIRMVFFKETYEREEKDHLFQIAEDAGIALIDWSGK